MSDEAKRAAAIAALDHVEDGMRLGLGTGSTAAHFVRALGERVAAGLKVSGVATSIATETLARAVGVPTIALEDAPALDLCVDGADEIDPALNLIKGAGGALLREKIVASASARFIVIADDSKTVAALGAFRLPIEVTPFAVAFATPRIAAALRATGCDGDVVRLRCTAQGAPYMTDGANHILDAEARRIPDPAALARALKDIPGVVEHGLFLGMADLALVAGAGGVRALRRDV